MKLLHCADLHIGHRAYDRLTRGGINRRETDVAITFTRLIDRMIALAPEVIVIGGDVFDVANPSNNAILFAFGEFSRLRAALPETIVVMVAGNHDTPKSSASGGILPLFTKLGVHVIDRAPQRLWFPERGLSVLGVADVPGVTLPALAPDPRATYNVLLLHGEEQGMPRKGGKPKGEIARDDIGLDAWTYAALGHWHVYTEIAPNCFYSGSIDYVSSDQWGELRAEREAGLTGKGFIVRDLETGAHEFHPLPASRAVVDLPIVELDNPSAADVDAAIRDAVESVGGIDDKIVRLVVTGVTREVAHAIDHRVIRQYRRRAMHFNLALERPAADESPLSMMVRGVTEPGARGAPLGQSVNDRVLTKLADRTLSPDVDRAALSALALGYLDEAAEKIGERDGAERIIAPQESAA